jgi:hypothetical protein
VLRPYEVNVGTWECGVEESSVQESTARLKKKLRSLRKGKAMKRKRSIPFEDHFQRLWAGRTYAQRFVSPPEDAEIFSAIAML